MKTIICVIISVLSSVAAANARTLIAYYSYTNNVHAIVTELQKQIDADVVRIEPAEKGLDYAADNYAIGSAQIAAIRSNPDDASSYPAIDQVDVRFGQYDTFIIAAPLWWSNMAAPMQTFLFQHGKEMAGKHVGLIVSSASSGISGVEADARRLVPDGNFMSRSLWIRSSQTSASASMIEGWLKDIGYDSLVSGLPRVGEDSRHGYTVYSLSGVPVPFATLTDSSLAKGVYIINGRKTVVGR